MKVNHTESQFRVTLEKIANAKNMRAKVGWLDSNEYPSGEKVGYIASIQEFGSTERGIPPRPFFRPTIKEQSGNWKSYLNQLARRVLNNDLTIHGLMDAIGGKAAGDVRKTMSHITEPPLSKKTLASRHARGRGDEILKDTGVMIPTLTHVVE